MGDEDKKAAVRLTEVLDKELDDQFWIGVYLLLHSPFFGYVGYRFAFEPLLPPDTFGFVGGAFFGFFYMLPRLLFFFGLPVLFVSAIFMLLRCLDSLSRGKLLESGLRLLYFVGLVSLATLSFSVVLGIFASNLSNPLPPGVRVSPKYIFSLIYDSTDGLESRIFEGAALAGYVIYNGVWMLLYSLFVFVPFVAIFLHLRRNAPLLDFRVGGWRISLGNFCFTLVVFILYFVHYDKQGTKKPGWTDYLG
jgi:hypothetical protein